MGLRIKGVGDNVAGATAQFRASGDKDWRQALPPVVCLGNKYADEPAPPGIVKGGESTETAASWEDAAPIIRRLHGSIFWLQPETEYEVQVSLTDAGGAPQGTLSAKARTKPDTVPAGKGRTLKVGAEGQYKKIVDAVKEAKPGDTVLVAPGVYEESVWMEQWPSGEPGNPITLRGEKGAILDGAKIPAPPGRDQPGFQAGNDVHAGINVKGAHDLIVEGFEVRAFDYRMFFSKCQRLVVQRNLIDCLADPAWAKNYGIALKGCTESLMQYNVVKAPAKGAGHYTRYPFRCDGGHENIIRYNRMLGGCCHDILETRNNSDTDVYENLFRGTSNDDGVELEGGTCINVRFFNNVLDCRDGDKGTISSTPVNVGPIYVVRNVFLCSAQVNKYYNDGTANAVKAGHRLCDFGNTFFYHNVFHDPKQAFFRGNCAHGRPVFINNISYGKAIADISKFLSLDKTSADYFRLTADHNLYWDAGKTTASPTQGIDEHSLFADPLFTDIARDDFTLKEGSPAIDKAVRLPNINDQFTGAGPDIGCFERGSEWTGRTLKTPLKEDPR
jgi:hypothetical protein